MKDNLKEYLCTLHAIDFYYNVSNCHHLSYFEVRHILLDHPFLTLEFFNPNQRFNSTCCLIPCAFKFCAWFAMHVIHSIATLDMEGPSRCGGGFRQAAQPGYGHAWKRATGLLLSAVLGAGCAPGTQPLWGSPSDAQDVPSFPCFLCGSPRRQLINKGWIHPLRLPKDRLRKRRPRPLSHGQGAVRPHCPPAAAPPPARRLVAAACCVCAGSACLATHTQGMGEGRGASTVSRGALLAPPPRRRGASSEAGLPLAFAVTSVRDSLQRAEGAREGAGCVPWRSPLAGRGGVLAVAAVWPGRRDHVSSPQSLRARGRRGRDGRPQVTAAPRLQSLEPRRSGREKGSRCPPRGAVCPCQPSEARRGAAPLTPPSASLRAVGRSAYPAPPAPPRKGEADCRTDVASNPAGFPVTGLRWWPGGRGAAGSTHPPPLRSAAAGVCLRGREAGSARDGRLPAPRGLPPYTRTLPERPRSREKEPAALCPRPGRRDLPGESKLSGCERALPQLAASGRKGLSLAPARRVEPRTLAGGEMRGSRDRGDRLPTLLDGPGHLGTAGGGERRLLPSIAVRQRGELEQSTRPPPGCPARFPTPIRADREVPQPWTAPALKALGAPARPLPGGRPARLPAAQPRKKSRARGGGRLKKKPKTQQNKKKADDESDFPSESLKVSTSSKHGTNLTSPPSLPPRPLRPPAPLPRLPRRAGDTGHVTAWEPRGPRGRRAPIGCAAAGDSHPQDPPAV